MAGILATKLDMTRVIKENSFIPVTLLKFPELRVIEVKTTSNNGYNALVLGILKRGSEASLKEGRKTLSKNDFSLIRELPLEEAEASKFNVGDAITLDILDGVTTVTISSFSKGKGFAGAMKRWNFHGGRATHGSKFHRALGSIGNRKPRRTHKGKKMHGHMGNEKITIKGVNIELVNKELSVLGVKGPVPGGRKSVVMISF